MANCNYHEMFFNFELQLTDYGFKDEHKNLWDNAFQAKVYKKQLLLNNILSCLQLKKEQYLRTL